MQLARLSLVVLAACADQGPPDDPDEVCATIRDQLPDVLAAADTPGALLAFDQPGQPLCVVAAGYSDPVAGTPASADQLYHIGSSTKTFVAATILLLAEDHAFDGKERLEDWLPGIVAGSDQISITHLLSNTSGIPNYLDMVNADLDSYDVTAPTTREELIAISQTVPPSFAPGTQFEYSNTNWILLGMIIERITGSSWREAVRSRVLEPNGLTETYADRLDVPAGRVLMRSWAPYQGADTDVTELGHPTWADSAGSMVSSVQDMAKWTRALYDGNVVGEDAHAAMLVPAITISSETGVGYSIGTITKPTPFGDWVGHGGDWVGSRSYLGGIPSQGSYLQVATNWIDSNRFMVADVAWTASLGDGLGSLAPFVGR